MTSTRSVRGQILQAVLATASLVLLVAPPAGASQPALPDPGAPSGASTEWLPDDEWVQHRWLPYSESRLNEVLDTDRYELGPWLRPGRRDLGDLARKRGLSVSEAVRQVMEPERSRVSARDFRLLRRRALKTFTQRHLMQHMLFHNFHTRPANGAWPRAIGLDWPEIGRRKSRGMSLWDVAASNGRDPATVVDAVRAAIRRSARTGVRNNSTSRSQARDWLARDLRYLEAYAKWKPGAAATSSQSAKQSRAFSAVCILY